MGIRNLTQVNNEIGKGKDHHLLLPLGKEEYGRMDSGGSSADGGGFGIR